MILMVVDPDNVSNILGYYHEGKIYADLRDIKLKRKEVSATTVYIQGIGAVDLDKQRAENCNKLHKQALLEARLSLDPMTRSLRGF